MGFSNSNSTNDVAGAMDAAAKRQSLIPNPQSLIPNPQPLAPNPQPLIPRPRGGFTLIEMLIVVAIMLMLVTLAVTIMPSATESRRIREAARGVNIYLSSARNRAMGTGRSCGVTFHFLGNTPCALDADQCEVPPPYAGDSNTSMATVTGATATLDAAPLTGVVNLGDLIQFNYQGPLYSITGMNGKTLTLGRADPNQNPLSPWAGTTSSPMPYCIFRSPMKGGATPLQLPAASVVDLQYSGAGNNENTYYMAPAWAALTAYQAGDTVGYNGVIYYCIQANTAQTPTNTTYWEPVTSFTVLFAPTGAVDKVYYNAHKLSITDTIYLLIGKRERVANAFVAGNGNESTLANVQDLNNLWVTINAETGLVNTEPLAAGGSVVAARSLATQGIGMGGK